MKASDLIKDLRLKLEGVKAAGSTGVNVKALEDYLAAAEPAALATENQADPAAVADADRRFEVWKTQASMQHAGAVELFKSALESGQTALRFLLAINGGAAIALLAFLGNVATKDPSKVVRVSVQDVNVAMAVFVIGVGLSAASAAFRYLTQFAAAAQWRMWMGLAFNIVAVVVGLASLAAFFVGGALAYRAFG